jgi:glutathione S-transferase
VLVHQGQVLQGSGAILDAAPELFGTYRLQPWLEPGRVDENLRERARELERLVDDGFGKPIQAFGYDIFLRDRTKVVDAWSHGGPWWSRAFYALAFGKIEQALRKGYCKNPEHIETSRLNFLAAFERTDAILEKQPYLLGATLARPDIALAALLCPVVRPKEHPLPWPEYPEPLEDFCRQLKERPTFRFVERLYREQRI